MEFLFEAKDVHVSYNRIEALHGVSLKLPHRSIVSVIGSNGAGKSTLLKAISALQPYSGEVIFDGQKLPQKAHKVVERGVIYVPEGRQIFVGLSVEENLRVGAYVQKDKSLIPKLLKEQYDLFPVLYDRRGQNAGTLSGGEQQMLAVCRGLMASPRMLLLDEPSLGLAPQIINQIFRTVQAIRDKGVSVLLIEQNAKHALEICDYAYVIESGRVVMEGKGKDLLGDERVSKAYLGQKRDGKE